MRQLITAAMLCTFSACSCGPDPCVSSGGVGPGGTGGFGGAGGSGVDDQVGYVGVQTSVTLQTIETFSVCNGQQVTVTGAEVEVLDPTNAKVAATGSTPIEQSGDVTVTVSFTPATPGPYHITVRFLPSSVTVQRDLLVAVDKSNEMAHTETLSPDVATVGCTDVDVDLGPVHTVLCLAPGGALYSMQNGQTIGNPWPADFFALTEGKVWTYWSQDMNLHLLGLGSDGSLTDLASLSVGQGVTRVLAQGDDALVLATNAFAEAHYSADGGLSVLNNFGLYSVEFAQWVPNVGVQIFDNANTDICSFSLAGGTVTPLNLDGGTCTGSSNVNLIGFDDDGLWTLDAPGNFPDLQTIEVTGWQAGATRSSAGSLSYSTQTPPVEPGSSLREVTPILYMHGPAGVPSDLYLPHFDGTAVTLTRYPLVAPNEEPHADSHLLWKITNNSTLTWWPR